MLTLIDNLRNVVGTFCPDADCRLFEKGDAVGHAFGEFHIEAPDHPAIKMLESFEDVYETGAFENARTILEQLVEFGINAVDRSGQVYELDISFFGKGKMVFFFWQPATRER